MVKMNQIGQLLETCYKNNQINTGDMITHKYHQTDLIKALNVMKNHKELYCKVMTFWNEE